MNEDRDRNSKAPITITDGSSYSLEELTKIRDFFAGDKYATAMTGIVIADAGDGSSLVSLDLDERHKNAAGNVMGAVYTTMADFAFAVAVNSQMALDESSPLTVTLSSNAYFLSSARSDKLFARARRIKEGRQTCLYEIIISETYKEQVRELVRVEIQGYLMNN
ncbi:MAG: PaaI family thioesterase [Lachnospiraceae bacterium]|nr:PaaI family thioesterase [Lachnospiraceae bacterium]